MGGVEGFAVSKIGSHPFSRDSTKIRDQNIQLCNRIGCSGRLNPATSTQNIILDKTKVPKPSSRRSAHGKDIIGNPSKVGPKVTNPVKPLRVLRKKSPSPTETDSPTSCSSTSSDIQEAEVVNSNTSSEDTPRAAPLDQRESQSGESTLLEVGRPIGVSNARAKRTFSKKPASLIDPNLASSGGSRGSKSTPQLSRPNASTTRPGSRYLRSNSVPDVVSSDPANNNRKQMLKRSSEGESSSTRAKHATIAVSARASTSRSGISISDTRQVRSSRAFMDNVSALVRAHRSDTSTRLRPPQMSRHELPTNQRMLRLPNSLSTTGCRHRVHNVSRPSTTESSRSGNLTNHSGVSFANNPVDHEGFRHLNIDGIAEMLLAYNGFAHDEEIAVEQLLALDSNMFHGGLNYDQHRDMRLDIDNMSYEELLALEERMGSVSTALSEEALAKCIDKSVYNPEPSEASFSVEDGCEDDAKCSICQEEYTTGDEMGSLHCKHNYHLDCIDQWLRQKNWCPICKSSAASSSS